MPRDPERTGELHHGRPEPFAADSYADPASCRTARWRWHHQPRKAAHIALCSAGLAVTWFGWLTIGSVSRAEWDALVAKVDQVLANQGTLISKANSLLAGETALANAIAAIQAANGVSPEAVQAVIDTIKSNTSTLAAALAANTPK